MYSDIILQINKLKIRCLAGKSGDIWTRLSLEEDFSGD